MSEDPFIFTPEQLIGRTLDGRYTIDEVLASGGMGLIFVGIDERTHRRVAIKLLKPHEGMDRSKVTRFLREVDLAARLRHPHIVDVLDLGTTGGGTAPYLVMELLTGSSLQAELDKKGKLGVAEALELLLPVMSALARVHEEGVVHRDVKPANIFLSQDGYGRVIPKLLDFGIAKIQGDISETASSAFLGTPAYMAPEQLKHGVVGATTDVWGMGAVLYRCLSGEAPYTGETPGEVIAKVATEAPAALCVEGVSRALCAAVDRALQRAPKARYPDMYSFSGALISSARAAGIDVEVPAPLEGMTGHVDEEPTEERQSILDDPAPAALAEVSTEAVFGTASSSRMPPPAPARRRILFYASVLGVLGLGMMAWWSVAARVTTDASLAPLSDSGRAPHSERPSHPALAPTVFPKLSARAPSASPRQQTPQAERSAAPRRRRRIESAAGREPEERPAPALTSEAPELPVAVEW